MAPLGWRSLSLLACIYVAAVGVASWAGYSMDIRWDLYQVLDREVLLEHPFRGLLFLHSQPPLLNATLAPIPATAGSFLLDRIAIYRIPQFGSFH